jgi:hypothetical protein
LCSPMPSRWWSGEGFKAEEDFFNKQPLLWRGDGLRQLLLPLSGHGGSDRSWNLLRLCDNGEGKGDSTSPELNYADGIFASAILCRKDGEYSTSSAEAFRTRAKWFVPGGLETTNGCSSSPEGSQRAPCSCSSAATPGGRRRAVAATPRDLIA